jgi:hypothetical protein
MSAVLTQDLQDVLERMRVPFNGRVLLREFVFDPSDDGAHALGELGGELTDQLDLVMTRHGTRGRESGESPILACLGQNSWQRRLVSDATLCKAKLGLTRGKSERGAAPGSLALV